MSTSKRILIVDDEEDQVTVVESRLTARRYTVQTTDNLEQALKILSQTPPDMVFLGLNIWKKHGSELCERIRGSLGASTTPILLMAEPADTASLIMSLEHDVDDFILKPFTALELQLRVALNFHRNEERIQANPLSKLPGNIAIDKEIRKRIEQNQEFSVCYIDIDNFKAFNDSYGFNRGDDVLLQTSNIIRRTANHLSRDAEVFVGHIGGDDFLVILKPKYDHVFAHACIKEFDRIILTYYKQEDLTRGSLMVKNRKGRAFKVPLMSLSIASISNETRKLESPRQVAHIAAEVKKFLKTQPGSNFLKDRREQPLRDIDSALDALGQAPRKKKKREEKEPLGQILLNAGLISEQQLSSALDHHFKTGQRLGQVLIQMNLCRSEDVGRMLERKLGVRYISLNKRQLGSGMMRQFTEEYVRIHHVCPVQVKEKRRTNFG